MTKLSVILATYNEEKNIGKCLESVRRLADEIVVVDGSSTDKTVAIAKKYTSRIFIRKNLPMFHRNKQLAIEKARGDWILYLDADERVSLPLQREVASVIRAKVKTNGFWVPRKNIIFGKWIKHTGWWPDYQLRLFKKGKAFLPCRSLHEQPKLEGRAGYLKNALIHYNYQTVSQFVSKLNNLYTENDKNVFLKKGKRLYWYDAIRFPTDEFLKRFFGQEGYKDGLHGLVLSLLQAFSALVTFAKIWENYKFREVQKTDFLGKVEKESKAAGRKLMYWFLTSKMEGARNPFKKIYFRLKRKVIL